MMPRKAVVDSIEYLQSELDVADIWRVKNPQAKSYTWSQKSPIILCRLDFWLISNSICDFVYTTDIIPAIKTDAISLALGEFGRGVKVNLSPKDVFRLINSMCVQ